MPSSIAFFDLETSRADQKIMDAGAVTSDGRKFHDGSAEKLIQFLQPYPFIAGHNIVAHDLPVLGNANSSDKISPERIIDTLLLSPLLFPNKPYHRLLKDDKFDSNQINNPVLDSEKSRRLLEDEISALHKMPSNLQSILASLLYNVEGFHGFFQLMDVPRIQEKSDLVNLIMSTRAGQICSTPRSNVW